MVKTCYTCGETKPLECYSMHSRVDGKCAPRRDCKKCRAAATAGHGTTRFAAPPEPLELDGFLPMPAPLERRALVAAL